MKTGRQTYTAETPASLFPESFTVTPIVQAPCSIGLWDLIIPSELLNDILSRLGLKDNIRASVICKTWCEAALTVRKIQPRPWLFYLQQGSEDGGDYILSDPSRSQIYKLKFPELKFHRVAYSMDGWLLALQDRTMESFLLNPFTREHIYLPKSPHFFLGHFLAFSAAPTSSSCLVISFSYYTDFESYGAMSTWRPGETVWRTYRFKNNLGLLWDQCVFSNGIFCCLSVSGSLGFFNPAKATWTELPVKPYPVDFLRPKLMTEHKGGIFVMFRRPNKNPRVFKLNLNRKVWEETRELGGLTIFASRHVSLTRAGLPSEMRNRIYTSHYRPHDLYYYSLGDEKRSCLPSTLDLPHCSVWVDLPHNVTL